MLVPLVWRYLFGWGQQLLPLSQHAQREIKMSTLCACSALEVQDMGCVMRLELLDVKNPQKC